MDNRKSERVQFFNIENDEDIQPVWVFRRTSPDAALGLLVDISLEGLQVLTDKTHSIADDTFQLTIHLETDVMPVILVNHKWSQDEGTLYVRSGFAFEEQEDILSPTLEKVFAARDNGRHWLRCELLGLSVSSRESAG